MARGNGVIGAEQLVQAPKDLSYTGNSINSNPTITQPKKIASIQFGLLSAAEMSRCSEFEVTSHDLFSMPSRRPARGGVLDPRLGVSGKDGVCHTCKEKLQECAGHYGHVNLSLPVFHIGFFKHTLSILQSICKHCSCVLLKKDDEASFRQRFRERNLDILGKGALVKKVLESL